MSARQVFAGGRRTTHARSCGANGMDVVEAADRRGGVRLAYVTPSRQFPLGGVLPLARRLELLQWAERRGCVGSGG